VHANVAGAVMFGAYVSFQFVVTLYLQNALGWSPMAMAFGFLPAGVLVVASALKMGSVLERFDTRYVIAAGLASFAAGYALFLRVSPGMGYVSFLLPTMLLLGLGFALCFPSINAQATAGVADHEQGLASGLVNTSLQIGGAVMLAIISAVIGAGSGVAQPNALLPGMTTAIQVVVALTVVGLVSTLALIGFRRPVAQPAQVPTVRQLEDCVAC
jgi:sugar phosphate permease